MEIVKGINQTIAFLLELIMVFAVGYWGYHVGKTTLSKYSLVILLPVIAIVLWGVFAAPRSAHRLEPTARLVFVLVLFGITSFLIHDSGHTKLAIAFAVVAVLNTTLAYIYKY